MHTYIANPLKIIIKLAKLYNGEANPIVVLKELVANLQKEQNKVQDLLSSLGFALRSFSNLNQFLELTPLMAARVTDAIGGALILYKKDRIRLEQIHCQDSKIGLEIRQVFERVNYQINNSLNTDRQVEKTSIIPANLLDKQLEDELTPNPNFWHSCICKKCRTRSSVCV